MSRCGETLHIDNGSTEWEVEVRALSDKRGSAEMAQKLYAETAQSILKRQQDSDKRKFFKEPSLAIKGRPTKRDRRLLDKIKIMSRAGHNDRRHEIVFT
jgi:ribosome-associated heat shock protein Hsp15